MGTHAVFELNGARYTLGSSPVDSIWRQNVNPADLRPYPLSETQGQTRGEQLLHATDCLGWLKEEPRPPIFAFLPLADKFKDRRCLGLRFEPGLPHDVRNGATASAADGSGTAAGCAFTRPVRDTPTILLVSLSVHRDAPTIPLRSLCTDLQGCTLTQILYPDAPHNISPPSRVLCFYTIHLGAQQAEGL